MHTSLDQALGRQPRLNRVGQSILNIGGDTFGLAYSLRSLTGGEPKAVRIRRDGDNEERDFTTADVVNEAAAWTNGLQETTLPADLPSTSSSITGFTISGTGDASSGTYTTSGTLLNGKLFFTKTGANDEQVRYDGSKWLIWDDDNGEAYWTPTNNQDTEFPWDVTSWTVGDAGSGGTPVFSSFVGGNPDNSAAAAYSLRKVRSTYSGPAVRIRRTSDDIDADVAFDTNDTVSNDSIVTEVLSGNQSTLQAFISGTNAAVATWYDQSGNSKNATQTTDANQPLIAEGGSLHTDDGKPALKFDGTSHRLELSAKATIANTSIFSAFRSNSNSQDSVLFHIAADANNVVSIGFGDLANRSELGSRLRVGGSDVVQVGDNTFTSTSQSLLGYIASSTAAKLFVDSTEETATVESRSSGANNRIGARGNDAKFFNGDISEVILFDSDQTNNRFKIESNINNHYTIYTAAQNGFVNTWYDQSGNSKDLVNTASSTQPKIVNSGSYLGYIDFSLNTQKLLTPSLSGSGVFPAGAKMASLVVASSDANAFNQVWADPTYKFYNYFAVNSFFLNTIGGSAVTQGQFNQFGGYFNGSSSVLDKNNAAYATGTLSNTASELTSLSLGDGSTAGVVSKFQIKELVLNNSNSDSISTQISTSQINHFGTPN